jgi:3-oxoacid CoA-transferase subunit B
VTGTGCVDLIVSDLAVIERDKRGLVLRECAPGFDPHDIVKLTEAPLTVDLWPGQAAGPARSQRPGEGNGS